MRNYGSVLIVYAWLLSLSVAACDAQPQVTITTKDGRQVGFQVEVADTPGKREMGLMYRTELADDRGMIFIFPGESGGVRLLRDLSTGRKVSAGSRI
jgi:hypothetical protein